jgi:hypothetical protein
LPLLLLLLPLCCQAGAAVASNRCCLELPCQQLSQRCLVLLAAGWQYG